MGELQIFELDPTGGCCGFPAEIPGLPPADMMRHELIRRNKIVKQLEQLQITVKRNFLKTVSFLTNDIVKDFVRKEGNQAFPVFLYEAKIIHSGSFPTFEDLSEKIEKSKG